MWARTAAFVDRPYFFFGGQIPELEDAIDLAVNADDLYVLHSDGRISDLFLQPDRERSHALRGSLRRSSIRSRPTVIRISSRRPTSPK